MCDVPEIRLANLSDVAAITLIYNESITDTTASWQTEPETLRSRASWLFSRSDNHPVIVAQVGDDIAGWGAISQFRPQAGWKHTVEDSVYVDRLYWRQGIGRLILTDLIERARALGHHTIIAGISGDQAGSIALHASLGFEEVGRIQEGGRKFDRWLDCVFMELII